MSYNVNTYYFYNHVLYIAFAYLQFGKSVFYNKKHYKNVKKTSF